jgi:hypothetical protein
MTLKEVVIRHFKEHKTITSFEAFAEYGITRLSAIIFDLRKIYRITDEWVERTNRYGEDVRFKRYIMKGKRNAK